MTTALILATSLSLTSMSDYVYSTPMTTNITGTVNIESDAPIRGEDMAFLYEARNELSQFYIAQSTVSTLDPSTFEPSNAGTTPSKLTKADFIDSLPQLPYTDADGRGFLSATGMALAVTEPFVMTVGYDDPIDDGSHFPTEIFSDNVASLGFAAYDDAFVADGANPARVSAQRLLTYGYDNLSAATWCFIPSTRIRYPAREWTMAYEIFYPYWYWSGYDPGEWYGADLSPLEYEEQYSQSEEATSLPVFRYNIMAWKITAAGWDSLDSYIVDEKHYDNYASSTAKDMTISVQLNIAQATGQSFANVKAFLILRYVYVQCQHLTPFDDVNDAFDSGFEWTTNSITQATVCIPIQMSKTSDNGFSYECDMDSLFATCAYLTGTTAPSSQTALQILDYPSASQSTPQAWHTTHQCVAAEERAECKIECIFSYVNATWRTHVD